MSKPAVAWSPIRVAGAVGSVLAAVVAVGAGAPLGIAALLGVIGAAHSWPRSETVTPGGVAERTALYLNAFATMSHRVNPRLLGFGDPGATGRPASLWPPARISSWWALLAAVMTGLGASRIEPASDAALTGLAAFALAQIATAAWRGTRESGVLHPAAMASRGVLRRALREQRVITGAVTLTGAGLASVLAWSTAQPAWIAVTAGILGAILPLAVLLTARIADISLRDWRQQRRQALTWEQRWQAIPRSSLPAPDFCAEVCHSAFGVAYFGVPDGVSWRDYSKLAEKLSSSLGADQVAVTALSRVTPTGEPIPGSRSMSGFRVVWSTGADVGQHLRPSADPVSLRLAATLALQQAFQIAKLDAPEVVQVQNLASGDEHALTEAQVALHDGVDLASAAKRIATIRDALGSTWAQVGRRPGADTVSILWATCDPSELDLADEDRRWIESLRWEQAWRAAKLLGADDVVPELVSIDHLGGTVDRLVFTAPAGLDPGAVRDRTEILASTLGVAYLQMVQGDPGTIVIDTASTDPIPALAPYQPPEQPRWDRIPLGVGPTGEAIVWDLKAAPHALVCGQTGSGKTVLLQAAITGALQSGSEVVVIDPVKEGADFKVLQPHAAGWSVELHDAARILTEIYSEVKARKQVNAEHGVGAWYDLPDAVRPRPMLVVIDEVFSLVAPLKGKTDAAKADNAAKGQILDIIARLAREARSAGVHIALAAQRPDAKVLEGELRSNLGCRVLMGTASPTERGMVLRDPATAPEPGAGTKGRGVFEQDGSPPTVFQGYWLDPDRLTEILGESDPHPTDRYAAAATAPPPVPAGIWE